MEWTSTVVPGLNIIQDEMLEGIELSKSLTPDMDADALGGVVNLTMKKADPGFHIQGSCSRIIMIIIEMIPTITN